MAETRRPAEQEHFGAATPGEAQAENPRLDPKLIDDGATDGIAPEDVVRGMFAVVFNAGELDAIEEFVAPDHRNHDRIDRGRIADSWAISDSAGMREQLSG